MINGDHRSKLSRLVVVTPANDEAERLPALADRIAKQVLPPALWVIVNDGSTDDTQTVAETIAAEIPFAEAITRDRKPGRSFDSKVEAFRLGYSRVEVDHDFVAIVDADVRLPPDYYQRVIDHFETNPKCGVAGGLYRLPDGSLGRTRGGFVPGPAQVFRRETYSQIGGFKAFRHGGEDAIAVFRARMMGWETECLPDLIYDHGRRMGGGGGRSTLRASFEFGQRDWAYGNLPLFELVKLGRALTESPYLLNSLVRGAGYLRGSLSGQRELDDQTLQFIRSEQREDVRRRISPLLSGTK